MNELRVLFRASAGNSFRAQLADAAAAPLGVERDFTPFLADDDYDNLRWYLEEYMDLPDGGAIVRAQNVEAQLRQWGHRLHDEIFSADDNAILLQQLLDSPEPRELTIATDVSALLRLPWELMADKAGSLAQRLSVRRQLQTPKQLLPRDVKLPLRMLYIVSRPADAGFIDPRLTAKSLFNALDPLGASVRVDFCRPPTLARMEEMLRAAEKADDPYDLVHFDGHGTFMPETQLGALCFEEPDDGSGKSKTDLIRADVLGDLLAKFKIPLVVLEACRSSSVGKTLVFRSVAPRLIQAGVGSVLSMGHAVHVEAARLLLDRFYRELVSGTTIGHAVAQGRSALRTTSARWIETGPQGRTVALEDWFLPHLYQRGLDEPLVPRGAVGTQAGQYDVFLSHNHNDGARVQNIANLLSEKHGLRVWLDIWETQIGDLEERCADGIRNSRFTMLAATADAIKSNWVRWEIEQTRLRDPSLRTLLPAMLKEVDLPADFPKHYWVKMLDPASDEAGAREIASLVIAADIRLAREIRGYRPPPEHGQVGAFPPAPRFGFQGRARELYDLERLFRRHRGIVLHAMGGMGKTTLATEAANWWTRSGLFRDGACFLSFEQFANAERVVQALGYYCEGPGFDRRPAGEQRRRAIDFFQKLDVLWDNYESALAQFNNGAAEAASPYTDDERRRLADLFRDLTAGSGKGRLLVTCRPGETGLPGVQKMELHGLARADSLWLLHRILERDNISLKDERLSRDKLDPLLTDLADHPLSLEMVGPHLRALRPEVIRADFRKLLDTFKQAAPEDRNTSLRASLEFSRCHVSAATREALPWLGLFSGGVFEATLLNVSQIALAAWEPIRAELQSIALLRTEDDILLVNRPFLRFHPTLAVASADTMLTENPETRKRFVGVYLALMEALDKAFTGSQSRAAMGILSREEANYRTAVRWAVADKQHKAAGNLGDTFSRYLQMSARLREREAWVRWLREALTQSGFTPEAADYELEHAYTLFAQGNPQAAVDHLQSLIERLRQTTEFDAAFQLALAIGALGDILNRCGASAQAIPILRDAIGHWEALAEKVGGLPWEKLLDTPAHARVAAHLGNLAVTMGNLANALSSAGQHEDALTIAEKGVRIDEVRGDNRNAAAGYGQSASILMALGRYDEADARYELAIAAARQSGDRGLEGSVLQHQGGLALERNQLDRAARLYQQSLQRVQEADNKGGVMRTYNALGFVEQRAGRLAEARAWYEKSRELAVQLKDQPSLGAAAQNIGIVCQLEGEAARKRGDERGARRHFEEARTSVEESLRATQSYGNKPNEASAWGQLAQIHFLLGDLSAAERHAHEARQIRESLGLKEAWKDYNTLSEIAQSRGDTAAAAEWARKRDDLRAELKRRAGGGGISGEMLKALQGLTIACAQAGLGGDKLGPAEEEALAKLDRFSAPFPDFAGFLRQLAAGQLPPIPPSLPAELGQLLEGVVEAIRKARASG